MSRLKQFLALVGLWVLLTPLAINTQPSQAAFPGLNGKIVFTSDRDGNNEIYVMNADGSNQNNLTNNSSSDFDPAWSSDGRQIVFTSDRDGNNEIYVMNADGSGLIRLTNNTASDTHPTWSPGGSQIAFTSDRDGNNEIYVMNADGSGQINLTNSLAQDGDQAWSPNGSQIVFTSDRDGNYEIYVMNADGSGLTRLTNQPTYDYGAVWAPGGSQIAFTSDRDGNHEIYVMNANGTDQTNLTNNPANDSFPAWSPEGSQIAFQSLRDSNWEIYVMNTDGTGQTNLTNNSAQETILDWQPLLPGCLISAPDQVSINDSFTATVTCNGVFGVYGFQYDLNIAPSSPPLVAQATTFTPGNIFNGLPTLTTRNSVDLGYMVSLQSVQSDVSGNVTLGSIGFDTSVPGTAVLTLDEFILGDINGQEIPGSLAANPNATITILDLSLASFEGIARREAGANLWAAITVLADSTPPDTTGQSGDYFTFSYAPVSVNTNAILSISAPGHLGCLTPDLGLTPGEHTVLDPITLLAGDVDGSGTIDLTDSSIIAEALNGEVFEPPNMPDLDEDGRITVLDLIHIGRNYGQTMPVCQ